MIVVFYEDQRSQRNDFGLHRFVCQLVIDGTGLTENVFNVEKTLIRGVPCKGNGNVFNRCKEDLPKLSCRRVFAVYDQDKVNRLLGLKGRLCRSSLREGLLKPCEPKSVIDVILVDPNLEGVISAIRQSGLVGFVADNVFEKALNKDQFARDSVFNNCALNSSLSPDLRLKLLDELPDIKRLVTKIVGELREADLVTAKEK